MGHATLVEPGARVRLADHDPDSNGGLSKDAPEAKERLEAARARMTELQARL